MTSKRMWVTLAITIVCIAATSALAVTKRTAASAAEEKRERARVAFSHDLPRMNGDKLNIKIVEVNYGPGESSKPHSHPCAVIGYVVEGTLRTQVKGEPEAVYKAGESFYEAPNSVHLVSANASEQEPAKLLAYFVCDNQSPLSVEVPQEKPAEQR
jgi:quercetin dioxygenase-like cupin family protein